jgi:hypothetical protein
MQRRTISYILIFALSTAMLGESLHALPFLEHETGLPCAEHFLHVDSSDDSHDSDCSVCDALIQLQISISEEACVSRAVACDKLEIPERSRVSEIGVYFSECRGPPSTRA